METTCKTFGRECQQSEPVWCVCVCVRVHACVRVCDIVCPTIREIQVKLPAPEDPPPTSWWSPEADKSLLVGTIKHGKPLM